MSKATTDGEIGADPMAGADDAGGEAQVAEATPDAPAPEAETDTDPRPTLDDQVAESTPEPTKADEKLYAGKYKSVEDLEKAYKEAESKLGKPKADDTPLAIPDDQTGLNPDKIVEKAGLQTSDLVSQWVAGGSLTDEQYEALEAAGASRDAVDAYFEGSMAKVIKSDVEALGKFGWTKQEFDVAAQWLRDTDPDKADQLKAKLYQGADAKEAAIAQLKILHDAHVAKNPRLASGELAPGARPMDDETFLREQMKRVTSGDKMSDDDYRRWNPRSNETGGISVNL